MNVGEGLPASDIARAADCFGLPRLRPRALLVRLGLAGVGAFASAGDFGSTCNNENYAGIAWPAWKVVAVTAPPGTT